MKAGIDGRHLPPRIPHAPNRTLYPLSTHCVVCIRSSDSLPLAGNGSAPRQEENRACGMLGVKDWPRDLLVPCRAIKLKKTGALFSLSAKMVAQLSPPPRLSLSLSLSLSLLRSKILFLSFSDAMKVVFETNNTDWDMK